MQPDIPDPIRVFVIDAYRTTLWGLEKLVESAESTMIRVGSATSVDAAIPLIAETAPGVILLSAIGTETKVLEALPALVAKSMAKVLVVTRRQDATLQDKAIIAGARGVVDSEGSPHLLLVAITRIHEGEVWINRESVTRILSECTRQRSVRAMDPEQRKIATLTVRERQVVAAFATHPGATAKNIARLLNISEHTARNHLNSVYEKLQLANRVALFDYAQKYRLFEPSEVMH